MDGVNRSDSSNPAKNVDLQQTRKKQKQEVRDEKTKHSSEMNELRDQHAKEINTEKSTHKTHVQKQREQQQQSYLRAVEERSKQEARVRQEHRQQTLAKEKEFHDQRTDFEKQKKVENEVAMRTHNQQHQELQKHGTEELKKTHQEYAAQIQNEKQDMEAFRLRQREHYKDELDKEKDHYEGQLSGRANEFENRYNEGELKHQLVLEDQRLRYEDHYEKTKYDFLEKMKKHETLQKDPFYRVQDLGAEMADNGPLYQVALKVPEHELKNIKVHVQPDRITVSGARKYEQELDYQGEKKSTHSYQTLKQEFALPTPADKDLVKREYINGVLFVTAPKKGF